MSSVTLELDLPEDWAEFNMPPALDARLTTLLDQQDQSGELAEPERKEAGSALQASLICLHF